MGKKQWQLILWESLSITSRRSWNLVTYSYSSTNNNYEDFNRKPPPECKAFKVSLTSPMPSHKATLTITQNKTKAIDQYSIFRRIWAHYDWFKEELFVMEWKRTQRCISEYFMTCYNIAVYIILSNQLYSYIMALKDFSFSVKIHRKYVIILASSIDFIT